MKRETESFYEQAVRRATARIVSGLDDALDLEALAREAALSPLHFNRIFRFMLGETPLELHRRLRLERAALSVVHGDAPITRIAFEAGYETHESFTRAFRARYAVAPSAFRLLSKPRIELASRSGIHFASDSDLTLSKGEVLMDVSIRNLDGYRVFAVHHVGPYNRISEAFAKLGGSLQNVPGRTASSRMVALYHDDPEHTPPDQLRADAGIIIEGDTPAPEGVVELRIIPGKYACTVHVGAYTGLGDTWARFMGGWLPQSGHRMGEGPAFELYRNDPRTTEPEELVTELYMSLSADER